MVKKSTHDRLNRYYREKYANKKRNLQENLDIGQKILVLAERIKKKSAPGKFYKQMVQNISYFNKNEIFPIRSKQKIDKNTYYWVKNSKNNKYLLKRFERHKLFAVINNFIM